MNKNSLSSDSRTIETNSFSIKENLLLWENTMIPLNNVSMISSADLSVPAFPIWSIGIIVVGLILFEFTKFISILVILAGALWITYWYNRVSQLKKQKRLSILLNSGNTFSLIFYNKEFLSEVISVLSNILTSPEPKANVTFNIKDNTFNDGSGIINH